MSEWVVFCEKCGGVVGLGWCSACREAGHAMPGHFACLADDGLEDAPAVYTDYWGAIERYGLCRCGVDWVVVEAG